MSMDISDDGALLATGSADKTVKIWGLDFGDCHRSLLAHDDSIMVSCDVFLVCVGSAVECRENASVGGEVVFSSF